MSADNGIYILQTNDGEIRVAHAQAIENIEVGQTDLDKANVVLYFQNSKIYTDDMEAFQKAKELLNDVGYAEYGICTIKLDIPFPNMAVDEAEKIIDDYYKAVTLERDLNRVLHSSRVHGGF